MSRVAYIIFALTTTALVAVAPAAATAHPATSSTGSGHRCAPIRPGIDFYEAGRVASTTITVPHSRCTTIAVSNIRDPRVPTDHCQTFLVAFFPADGTDPIYTTPVDACSVPASKRTVLATDVPDGAVFRVLYQVDYIDPVIQTVGFRVWR